MHIYLGIQASWWTSAPALEIATLSASLGWAFCRKLLPVARHPVHWLELLKARAAWTIGRLPIKLLAGLSGLSDFELSYHILSIRVYM